ncbi:MAG: hypothetical protein U0793_14920 [Gemmataceae bacterium]
MLLPARHRCWSPFRWLGALALASCLAAPLCAQDPLLRQSFVSASDSRRPVQLLADSIATWQEGGIRIFLLQGKVAFAQNSVIARANEAVIWVDEEGQKKTGVFNIKMFARGASLEADGKSRAAEQAVLEFASSGGIKINTAGGKIASDNRAASTLYKDALRIAKGFAAPFSGTMPGPVIPALTSDKAGPPGPPPPPATVKGGPTTAAAAPPAPFPLTDTSSLRPAPAPAGDIRLVQALEPAPIGLPPPPPAPPPGAEPTLPAVITPPPYKAPDTRPGPALPLAPPDQPPREVTVLPRSSTEIQARNFPLESGETAVVITSGVILRVTDLKTKKVMLDIEADRLVFWTKGESGDVLSDLKAPSGKPANNLEFYLSGNVEIRNQVEKETQILRAEEVYYDVGRGVAVAMRGEVEIRDPNLRYPFHLKAEQILQLNPKLMVAKTSKAYASALPSDPGLTIEVTDTVIEEKTIEKKTIFGFPFIDPKTGGPQIENDRFFTGRNMLVRIEGVPVFYFPYLSGNIRDPLGPLEHVSVGYSRVFGFRLMTSWDIFDLLGVKAPTATHWRLNLDYLSARGPAVGTDFDTLGKNLFGIPNSYLIRGQIYGIYDTGTDILGGDRGKQIFINPVVSVPVTHPDFRGRINSVFEVIDLPNGFQVKGQLAAVSDQNFLEQYFPNEWLNGLNGDAWVYVKQQNDNWAWSIQAQPNLRPWITETALLPRADGYILGQKFFDLFTYNLQASAEYAKLRTTSQPSFAYLNTDVTDATGRFDLTQELAMPFQFGAFKIMPYVLGEMTYYTNDLTGNDSGRLYGAAGVRASIPFSKLYPDICSELFNLNGIYHKILFYNNYYVAGSTQPYTRYPQLDRLNDDASDQALRDIRPWQVKFNPQNGLALTNSPVFDPQLFAIRRLIDSYIDTKDDIQVLQLGVSQRWQTRRGLPGADHVVDWMTLDLRASLFPAANRDDFGKLVGILEYDWVWNIGDRTALTSSLWYEPVPNNPLVFNVGAELGRPDTTRLYLGYRKINPLESQAFIASITYPFSAKYALTGSVVYDFGINQVSSQMVLSRIGSDLMVNLGFNYNSTVNSFGVQFEIVPTLLPDRYRTGGITNPGAISHR